MKQIIAAYASIVIAIIVHLVVVNIRRARYHYKLILRVGIAGFLLYAIWSLAVYETIFLIISGAIMYIVAFSLYAYNYTTMERSLSVNMLVDFENAGEEGLELEKVIDLVSEKETRKRLNYLIEDEYIFEDKGRYKITRKGRFYALLGKRLKSFLGLGC